MRLVWIGAILAWCAVLGAASPRLVDWFFLAHEPLPELSPVAPWHDAITPEAATLALADELAHTMVPEAFAGHVAELRARVRSLRGKRAPWSKAWRRLYWELWSAKTLFAVQARVPEREGAFELLGLAEAVFLLRMDTVLTGELNAMPVWKTFPGEVMHGVAVLVPERPVLEITWSPGALVSREGNMAVPAGSVRIFALTRTADSPHCRRWNYAPVPVSEVTYLVVQCRIPQRMTPGEYLGRVTVTDRRSRETKQLNYQLKVIAP